MPISAEDNVSTADLEYFATRTNNHPVVFCEKGVQASGFSWEFCEISKNTFSYKTPPVAASLLA